MVFRKFFKSLLKLLFQVVLFTRLTAAMDTPIVFGGNGTISTSVANYIAPQSYPATWGTVEAGKRLVSPIDCTLKNLYVRIPAGTTTGSYKFTIYKNGSATALLCTVATAATTCNNTSDTVSIAPTDTFSLQSLPVSSPDVIVTGVAATLLCSSTTPGESFVLGATNGNVPVFTLRYFPPQAISNGNVTIGLAQAVMPTDGVIDHLYVDLDGAPGAGTSYVITVNKNLVIPVIVVTVADGATTGSDLVNSVSYVAGDLITVSITQVNTPTVRNIRWGMRWLPTVDGESIQLFGSTSLGTSSSTQYQGVAGGVTGVINATEADRSQLIQACTIKKMYLDIVAPVGLGNTVDFTVMKNTVASAITAQIAGAVQTTQNDTTNTFTTAAGDRVDMRLVKSAGMPAGDGVHTGLVTFIDPPTPTPTFTPTNTPTATPTLTPTFTPTSSGVTNRLLGITGVGQ